MKATGVVRRIDELGRIVIPKEIRKVLKIRNGDSLEIYTDNSNNIILSKHSKLEEIKKICESYSNALYRNYQINIILIDYEKIIATNKEITKNLDSFKLNKQLERLIIESKETYINDLELNEKIKFRNAYLRPINFYGDNLGLIILASNNDISQQDKKHVEVLELLLTNLFE